jgi:hypothetical protein
MDDDDGFSTTPPPRDNTALSLARENVALLASLVAALIFALRCVVVTDRNLYTAGILLAQSSLGDAIRALLFSLLPSTLAIIVTVAAWMAGRRYHPHRSRSILYILFSLTAGAAWVYLAIPANLSYWVAPPWIVAFFSALLIFVLGVTAKPPEEAESRLYSVGDALALSVAILIFIGPTLVAKEFWLPHERLDFKNEAPFTGYVLKASEDHLVILNDKARVIIEKPKDTLEDRDFCYPEDHKARSSNVKSDAPECP